MKKIEIKDCSKYFQFPSKIRKNIKAEVLDFEYDEEIDEGLVEKEITEISKGMPIELWTVQQCDYIYRKKYYLGHMWERIRKEYLIDVFDEIESYKEENFYLMQIGKAKLNRKSIKSGVNYLKRVWSSFLIIGEYRNSNMLMDMLYELEKSYDKIVDIINLVCDGKNKVIYLMQGSDGASLVCFSQGNPEGAGSGDTVGSGTIKSDK